MKFFALILAAIFLFASPASAAVSFTHASNAVNGPVGTSKTWTHDATGDNYLVVLVNHRTNPGTVSATYNGDAMTLLDSQAASFNWEELFVLANPDSGTNNIVVSWTSSANVCAVGMSFTGVDSVGATQKANVAASSADYGPTATLAVADMLVGASGVPDYPSTISVVTGTERSEGGEPPGTGADCAINGATNTGVGSVQILWDYTSAGDPKTYIALPLIGAVAPAAKDDFYFISW